jgi:hypothetical protein
MRDPTAVDVDILDILVHLALAFFALAAISARIRVSVVANILSPAV